MKKLTLFSLACLCLFFMSCDFSKYKLVKHYDFATVFEKSKGTKTETYEQVIKYYQDLADAYATISIKEMGMTDSGKPLHVIIYNPDKDFDFDDLHDGKTVILINNGIHPGESDGIDATMLLLRDYAQDSLPIPKNVVIATIPIYNIGGALNRNSHSRVNQNGPEVYGFRGNAQDYDLNRDFIKADTKNAQSFAAIFHQLDPDFFIDNHVSNGADYQYVLTHLFTQHDKLGGRLGDFLQEEFRPALEDSLAQKNWPITPYVNVFNESPEVGFSQFMDYSRYSTGYAALWNTPGMMVETHMLKPYKQRVEGNYELMETVVNLLDHKKGLLDSLRKENNEKFAAQENYYLNYIVDSTKVDTLQFKGYEAETKKSEVTGKNRLFYNRENPYTRPVAYYDNFEPSDTVKIPKYYVIPQGWWPIIDRLKQNKIEMQPLEKDSTIAVETYRIAEYQTREQAYEGHYPHFDTHITSTQDSVHFRKGDWVIPTKQAGIRYLLETLEPISADSFFNWNFFDTILQQKEGFSPYVFVDSAAKFLAENPSVKKAFEAKKAKDVKFENNWHAQLKWVQQHSPYYEKAHLRYPVFRILK